jgi:AcrR family transcriptional regulator
MTNATEPTASSITGAPPVESDVQSVAGSVRRGRGRPRNPETDRRITTAAAELMLLRGFERMTVDDVAAKAGVGKATVYRRWPSKDDLAVAAMAEIYATEMPDVDTGSIRTDLKQSLVTALSFVNSPRGQAYLRTSMAEAVRDERIAALYRASAERVEANAAKMYERAIARGEVRADIDLSVVVQWVGGLIAMRAITHRPLPELEDVDALVDFTLRGVLADEASDDDAAAV